MEGPSWSPDGEYLTLASNQDGGDGIFIIRPDGSSRRKLTSGFHRNPSGHR